MPFATQMLHPTRLRDEEIVRDGVRHHAIDFFGHGQVTAAQTGFDVRHLNTQFFGNYRTGQGGVDVTDDHHQVWLLLQTHFLETRHHFGSLHRMASAADVEVVIRLRDLELLKKYVTHVAVVMLTGVHDLYVEDSRMAIEGPHDGRNLHKIGARARDDADFSFIGWHD